MTEENPRTYRLISGDSHVNEPPDLWTSRMPAKFQDRAPRMQRFEEGDAWILEGVAEPITFGFNACAGMDPKKARPWAFWEDIRQGGADPKVRISEQDQDGVDAEILYPTPRINMAVIGNEDPEFHLSMVQAYNDWISEYAAVAPDRFGGLALIPNRGVDQAVAEIERVKDNVGIVGFVLGCYPHGDLELGPEDDPVWELLEAEGIPVHIHVALSDSMPREHKSDLPGYGRFFDAPTRMLQFVFRGVLDRYPALKVVMAETDCGWVPYVKEQIDNNFRRLKGGKTFDIQRLPSEYVEENFYFTFITDSFAINNRHLIGPNHMLWSSDYPHVSADWPNSWRTIQAAFSDVPPDERKAILAGNCIDLYGFGT